ERPIVSAAVAHRAAHRRRMSRPMATSVDEPAAAANLRPAAIPEAGPPRPPGWERWLGWISHPLLLPLIVVLVAAAFGRYEGNEIGHLQSIPLFLQGSTDWGGSNLFAVTVALYVVCGFLGAIQLSVFLSRLAPDAGLLERIALGT